MPLLQAGAGHPGWAVVEEDGPYPHRPRDGDLQLHTTHFEIEGECLQLHLLFAHQWYLQFLSLKAYVHIQTVAVADQLLTRWCLSCASLTQCHGTLSSPMGEDCDHGDGGGEGSVLKPPVGTAHRAVGLMVWRGLLCRALASPAQPRVCRLQPGCDW